MSDYVPPGQGFEDFLDPDWPAFMQTSGPDREGRDHDHTSTLMGTQTVDTYQEGLCQDHPHETLDQSHRTITTKSPQSSTEDTVTSPRHQCTFEKCSREYIRKADLTRHQKKHSKTVRYDCPILACKFRGDRANTRRDKFVQHLLKGHPEAHSWPCLVESCDMKLHSIVLLAAHLVNHPQDQDRQTSRSILTAVSIERSDCPIRGCHMKISPKHLMDDHTPAQRLSEADSPDNFEIDSQQCALTCPVCRTAFPCDVERKKGFGEVQTLLRQHIAMKHVALDQEHVRGFDRHGHWYLRGNEVSKCPGCDFRPNGNYFEITQAMQKHLDTLWDNSLDIYRVREQILRIDTSFWRHPVFDDLRPRST